MDQLSIIALLYRLGAFAERLSWWAFDRSSRMREEHIHRMALDKMRVAGPGYGFARTTPVQAGTDAAQAELAQAAPAEVPQPVRTVPPADATRRIAAAPTPIRPAALSKPAEAQDEDQDSTVKTRRTALG